MRCAVLMLVLTMASCAPTMPTVTIAVRGHANLPPASRQARYTQKHNKVLIERALASGRGPRGKVLSPRTVAALTLLLSQVLHRLHINSRWYHVRVWVQFVFPF